MTEAPYSWNVRYLSPDGFQCQLTIRSETSGQDIITKGDAALKLLVERGCRPEQKYGGQQNGHSQDIGLNGQEHYCKLHQTPFKRFEKNGRSWYSHFISDGDGWCTEKEAKTGK